MAKKLTSKDKIVNKMTKDGLEELNVTKGTKENISNRIKDISLERTKEKLDLKTQNIDKKKKNIKKKIQKQNKNSNFDSVESYSKVNNPGYEKGNFISSSDTSIRKNTKSPNKKSFRPSKKSTDELNSLKIKIHIDKTRFKFKHISDKAKLQEKSVRFSNSHIKELKHKHSNLSLKNKKLQNKRNYGVREKIVESLEEDDNSLQSDTFKTVNSTNQKLQNLSKSVRKIKVNHNNKKAKEKIKNDLLDNRNKFQSSRLQFYESKKEKHPSRFLLSPTYYTFRFAKDSTLDSIEKDKSLHSETFKFVTDSKNIIGTKINTVRKLGNLREKPKTQKDLNKSKSALNQQNKDIIQHEKKRNLNQYSKAEKKKLQKLIYKKHYAKAFKSSELKKSSETFEINQSRFVMLIKSSKAAMVRVVTAFSSLLGIPLVIAFFFACVFMLLVSISSIGGAVVASIVYQSSDIEITKTNGYFSELEVDLAIDIIDTEQNHPVYDEYEYSLDNIGHDPHMIASYLSVIFSHGFELEDSKVKSEIEDLFSTMYRLERIPRTEIRYSGETSYTVTILRTVLNTKPLEDVIDSKFGLLGVKEKISYKMFYEAKGSFTFMKSPILDDWKTDVIRKFGYSLEPDTRQKIFYPAIDIQPTGEKVFALVDGIISFGNNEFGEYLEILTFAGNRVRYFNVSNFLVEEGYEVNAGEELCSIAESSNDTYMSSFLTVQLIDKFDNYLDPYFYLLSNTDTLSDAYIVDFSQNNNYSNNPNYTFPNDVDFENYDEWVKVLLEESQKHLGKRYVFGANGPNTFDCSSFVTWTFTHSGVKHMPRTTAQGIYNSTQRISKEELRPGDIVFFTGTYNAGRPVTHVGIYVGNGTMIHAGDPVQYANLNSSYWQKHYYGAGRVTP